MGLGLKLYAIQQAVRSRKALERMAPPAEPRRQSRLDRWAYEQRTARLNRKRARRKG